MVLPGDDAGLRGVILTKLYEWRDWPKGHPDREITRALGMDGNPRIIRVTLELVAAGLIEGMPVRSGGQITQYWCGLTLAGIDVVESGECSSVRVVFPSLEDLAEHKISGTYASGEAYEVYRDVAKVIVSAIKDVFIVDPYANEEVFELYLEKVSIGVSIRLLTGVPSNALKTIAAKFGVRTGVVFEARSSREIHDRTIFVDASHCWVIGQSLKDAAMKKPTYLIPVGSPTDMLRLYEEAWTRATPY